MSKNLIPISLAYFSKICIKQVGLSYACSILSCQRKDHFLPLSLLQRREGEWTERKECKRRERETGVSLCGCRSASVCADRNSSTLQIKVTDCFNGPHRVSYRTFFATFDYLEIIKKRRVEEERKPISEKT